MARKKETKGNNAWIWVGAGILVLVVIALFALGPSKQEGDGKITITPPAELEAAACERIEPPFWAADCNAAFEQAYAYAFERYGEPERLVKASLRISRQSGYYVFGFDYNGTTACITINAADLNDIKEDEGACVSTTAG